MPNTYQHKQAHYADLYKRSTRSIQEYMRLQAPLDDPPAMELWLNVRSSKGKPFELPQVDEGTVADVPRGAPEALRRLAAKEAKAHVVLEQAEASGDPVQIEAAERSWYRACRELRYFDTSVEIARRDGEEMIPKAEAIDTLKKVCYQISGLLYEVIDSVVGESHPDRALMRKSVVTYFCECLLRFDFHWAPWAIDPIKKALDLQDEPLREVWCHFAFQADGKLKPGYQLSPDGEYVFSGDLPADGKFPVTDPREGYAAEEEREKEIRERLGLDQFEPIPAEALGELHRQTFEVLPPEAVEELRSQM